MEKWITAITKKQQEESLDDDIVLPADLMHRIQSLLSKKEAARTCVLSKSWRHAWSTIPNLRFPTYHVSTIYKKLIDNTIQRYHDHNLPIKCLEFLLQVENLESDEIWVRDLVLAPKTTSCLKKLCLGVWGEPSDSRPFTLSGDILFSGDKLQRIKLSSTGFYFMFSPGIKPVIKCVSLRVLELAKVNISEDVFDNLLSTCKLLEKVNLFLCQGLKTIKVKNLGFLCHLQITTFAEEDEYSLLEIDDVPSLGFLFYKSFWNGAWKNLLPFKTPDTTASSLGRSVTRLSLKGMSLDDTFFDMIESKFVVLERLTLKIRHWASKRLVINSRSLKRLKLKLKLSVVLIEDLQVDAPNLLKCSYNGETLPTLLFPTSIIAPPKQIKLALHLRRKPLHASFFLKLREVLNNFSASKFDIHINSSFKYLNTDDVDELRKGVVMFPVTNYNVQRLSLHEIHLSDRFFDACFCICHPSHVKVWNKFCHNRFSKLTVVRRVMKYNTTHYDDLKQVMIKNPLSGRWEALTSSWKTDFHDSLTFDVEFKLNWVSHDY